MQGMEIKIFKFRSRVEYSCVSQRQADRDRIVHLPNRFDQSGRREKKIGSWVVVDMIKQWQHFSRLRASGQVKSFQTVFSPPALKGTYDLIWNVGTKIWDPKHLEACYPPFRITQPTTSIMVSKNSP